MSFHFILKDDLHRVLGKSFNYSLLAEKIQKAVETGSKQFVNGVTIVVRGKSTLIYTENGVCYSVLD